MGRQVTKQKKDSYGQNKNMNKQHTQALDNHLKSIIDNGVILIDTYYS